MGKISATKMLTQWAVVAMLSVYVAATVDVLPASTLVKSVSNKLPPVPDISFLPLPLPTKAASRNRQDKKLSISKKLAEATKEEKDEAVAKYCINGHELMNHLNSTLPQKIEDMLKCEKVNFAGALGSVLEQVKGLDVGSLTSSLGSLTSSLGSVTSAVGSVTSPLESVASNLGSVTSSLGSGASPLGSLTSTLGSVTSSLGSGASPLGSLASTLGSGASLLGSGASLLGSGASLLGSGAPPLGSLTSTLGSVASSMGPVSSPLKSLSSHFDNVGLGGLLSKGKVPQALLGSQESQDSQPETAAVKNLASPLNFQRAPSPLDPVKEATSVAGGAAKALPSVDDVAGKVGKLKDAAGGALNNPASPETKDAIGGLLDIADLTKSLLGMSVKKVTTENMNMTITNEEIHASCNAKVEIGGEGVTAPVIDIMGYKAYLKVDVILGFSKSSTKCPTLEIIQKHIEVEKVEMQVLQTVENLPLPVPVPVPLNTTVSQLLTVKLNSQSEDSKSCDISLSELSTCQNSTGIVKYTVKNTKLSKDTFTVTYTAMANLDGKMVPVPGGTLPSCPKDANASMIISHNLMKTIVCHTAKKSSLSRDAMHTAITKIAYSYQSPKNLEFRCSQIISSKDMPTVTGETVFLVSRDSKISNGQMATKLILQSAKHTVEPPVMSDKVKGMMQKTMTTFLSKTQEYMTKANLPDQLTAFSLESQSVNPVKLDLMVTR